MWCAQYVALCGSEKQARTRVSGLWTTVERAHICAPYTFGLVIKCTVGLRHSIPASVLARDGRAPVSLSHRNQTPARNDDVPQDLCDHLRVLFRELYHGERGRVQYKARATSHGRADRDAEDVSSQRCEASPAAD